MAAEWVRQHCLSFPQATENVQWGNDLVFKVAGKMFAVLCLEPSQHVLSFKCTPEDFAQLTELPGIVPAPYLARAQWVAFEKINALPVRELKAKLKNSYELVVEKLPKSTRAALNATPAGRKKLR